jgi:hypothetical protein
VVAAGGDGERVASYGEIVERLRKIPLGTRIAACIDQADLGGIAKWIGWFDGSDDAGREGVWFSARDSGVPPTMLGFSIWRSGFTTGRIGPTFVSYLMRDVSVSVEWGFIEYPTQHDPLPDWSEQRRVARGGLEPSADAESFVLPTPRRLPEPGQRMAMSFKVEDQLPDGRRIGPVGTWLEDDPKAGWIENLGWMSEDDARALAARYGFTYYEE